MSTVSQCFNFKALNCIFTISHGRLYNAKFKYCIDSNRMHNCNANFVKTQFLFIITDLKERNPKGIQARVNTNWTTY